MDQETSKVIADISTQLAVLAAKGTATAVSNKVQSIRQKKKIEEICNSYEELINEIVAERAQAIAVAQAYEAELKRYEIGDDDIRHLQGTVGSALDILKEMSPTTNIEGFEQIKSLITVDTLKAMQLLGFDYKAAVGDPLTRACATAIETKLKVPAQKRPQDKK